MTEKVAKTKQDFKSMLASESVQEKFKEVLEERASSFTANLAVMVNNSEQLKKCQPATLVSAAVISASLDLPLDPNLGLAYIVPFKDKAQFQIGYKGLKQLAIRSGQYAYLDWCVTYDSDTDEDILNRLKSIRKDKKPEKVTGYAHYFRLLNGFESTFHMSAEEINLHAKRYSQTYKRGYGLWKDDFDKMAKKTIIKLHLGTGEAPLSIKMQKAIKYDQGVIHDIEGEDVTYEDNEAVLVEENPKGRRGGKEKKAKKEKVEEANVVEENKDLFDNGTEK